MSARDVLIDLLAHPVELLALLAEPQVCETCGGTGSKKPVENPLAFPCDDCHGSGSVAVDVLDLLGYQQVGWRRPNREWNVWDYWTPERVFDLPPAGEGWEPVYAAKDGTP